MRRPAWVKKPHKAVPGSEKLKVEVEFFGPQPRIRQVRLPGEADSGRGGKVVNSISGLTVVARSLSRPMQRGWMSFDVANACLIIVSDRSDNTGADLVAVWREIQAELRRAVAK